MAKSTVVIIAGQKFAAILLPSRIRPHPTVRVYVGGQYVGEGVWSPSGAGIVAWRDSTIAPHPLLMGMSDSFRPENILEELSMALNSAVDNVTPVQGRVMDAMRGGAVFAAMGVSVGFTDGHWWTSINGLGQRTDEGGAWGAARAAFDSDVQMEAELARIASV